MHRIFKVALQNDNYLLKGYNEAFLELVLKIFGFDWLRKV